MPPPDGHVTPPADRRHDVRTARLLVAAQFSLIGVIVLAPGRDDWPVPHALTAASSIAFAIGLALMVAGAAGLGRGLTATPLPSAHAQLRTTGLYRFARHPIYSGLLLAMGSLTVRSASGLCLTAFVALVVLLNVKARWEETRLAERFDGYAAYAARTGRFTPFGRRR